MREYKNHPAQIIGRDPNNQYSTLTINKGSRHGIRKNMPVIAVQNGLVGLVGKVLQVGHTTSLVMPIYDYESNVSARIQDTRDVGLVSGLGWEDRPLSMKYIKKRVLPDLQYGDLIVTSGENENFMKDIPIGYINTITVQDYDSSLNIELTPVVDFGRLEQVFVLTSYTASVVGGNSANTPQSAVEPTSPIPQAPTEGLLPTGGSIVSVG